MRVASVMCAIAPAGHQRGQNCPGALAPLQRECKGCAKGRFHRCSSYRKGAGRDWLVYEGRSRLRKTVNPAAPPMAPTEIKTSASVVEIVPRMSDVAGSK